jgi:short-subunit dehydrogenase
MDLDGRRVLVTGASRGIGEAIARACAAAGARVALVARSRDALAGLAAELGGTAHPADLGAVEAVAGLVDRVEADGGPVDVLVNNAGIDLGGTFAQTDPGDLELIFRVNLVTPVLLTRQVLPGMLARRRGHIVNVSSLAGVAAFPGLAAYSSTKAGLTQFTAGLRADLHGQPIGTTLVELGPVRTDLLSQAADFAPTDQSFQRFYRLQMLTDVRRETVADAVVDAVRHDRSHVRLPRRAAMGAMVSELPRRVVEVLLTGVPRQDG